MLILGENLCCEIFFKKEKVKITVTLLSDVTVVTV